MYICKYCGKKFDDIHKKVGHENVCKERPDYEEIIAKRKLGGKNARIVQNKKRTLPRKTYQCVCEKCNKEFEIVCTESQFFRKIHFYCSKSCANTRIHSEETKNKISISVQKTKKHKERKFCLDCGSELDRRTVGDYCKKCYGKHRLFTNETKEKLSKAGKKSVYVQRQTKRSKNEIGFCELCINYFKNVKHNENMFNGWDADVILEDYKIAILWNGPWHYKQISKIISLECIHNRDKIKIKNIQNCGYYPYIIKDMGKYNKKKIIKEFDKLVKFIKEKYIADWSSGLSSSGS